MHHNPHPSNQKVMHLLHLQVIHPLRRGSPLARKRRAARVGQDLLAYGQLAGQAPVLGGGGVYRRLKGLPKQAVSMSACTLESSLLRCRKLLYRAHMGWLTVTPRVSPLSNSRVQTSLDSCTGSERSVLCEGAKPTHELMPTRSKFGAQNYFVVGIKIPVTGRKTKPLPASSSTGCFWGRMCSMDVMRKGPEMPCSGRFMLTIASSW